MNPMEYFKRASESRNKLKEEQARAFIEDSAPSITSILPILTPAQQKAMDDQNLLLIYIAQKLGINPYAVSRDKNGHPLILELKNYDGGNYPELYCYTLGLNKETNNFMAYCVGKNTFRFTTNYGYVWPTDPYQRNNNLHINILSIHPAFDGQGIGRVLLQATENLAVANGIKSMSLKQEICYVPNSAKLSKINRVEILAKDMDKYFEEYYFDKNMYFYYSNGFEKDTSKDYYIEVTDGLVPLKKDRLQKITLNYGFAKPLVKVDRTLPMFALQSSLYSSTETAREYCYNNRFPTFLNNVSAEQFSPIVLKPKDSYTEFLHAFTTTRKGISVFEPTSEHKRTTAKQIASGNFDSYGYKYDNICSSLEFIQDTMEKYAELTNYVANPKQRKILPIQELLRLLFIHQEPFFKSQTELAHKQAMQRPDEDTEPES